ncbi:hypothetical protein L484_025758 [Morus notabilis]|uniref:Uncharacterized protein n=1 Tax=Morus notabilis TaxID=981085 RepID=W9R3R9_9ROSA|nr:hypothetical protein L484_025758 [Morus notabilis]
MAVARDKNVEDAFTCGPLWAAFISELILKPNINDIARSVMKKQFYPLDLSERLFIVFIIINICTRNLHPRSAGNGHRDGVSGDENSKNKFIWKRGELQPLEPDWNKFFYEGNDDGDNNRQVGRSSNRAPMEDSSSPYYLHNGDHSSLSLVSHQLTGPN